MPGHEEEFQSAFAEAKLIISASPGFVSLSLSRCIERPNVYLMLIEWERLEDHLEGFRNSEGFLTWRALLHHFYDPKPVVEHFEEVATA